MKTLTIAFLSAVSVATAAVVDNAAPADELARGLHLL